MNSLSNDTQYVAVGASSAQFTNPLREGVPYQITSSTAAWIRFDSANPTAVAAANLNSYVPANFPIQVLGPPGGLCKMAIIQDAAGGKATLTALV
jgi:hypothetical protein